MIIHLRVSTNSDKPGVEKIGETQFKVRVRAKPTGGDANQEITKRLAEHFEVNKAAVRILQGHTSHKKTICVDI